MMLCGCDGRTVDSSRQDGDAISGRLHNKVAGRGFQHAGVRGPETGGQAFFGQVAYRGVTVATRGCGALTMRPLKCGP
jgi:hypothetical protein